MATTTIRIPARATDGIIEKRSAVYATARALSSGGAVESAPESIRISDRFRIGQYELTEAFLSFNTSILGANADIASARLAIRVEDVRDEPAMLTARDYPWLPPLQASYGIDGGNLAALASWATAAVFATGERIFTGEIPVSKTTDTGMLMHFDTLAAGTVPTHGLRSVTFGSGNSATPPELIVEFEAPAPVITNLSPSRGIAGAIIAIIGENFGATSAVTVNGNPVTLFEVVSATQINAVVAAGATGKVAVTTPFGSAESVMDFTYLLAPTITNVAPIVRLPGEAFTITGTFLDGATVKINSAAATVTAIAPDGTSIDALTPAVAYGTYDVTVETTRGNVSYPGFSVMPGAPTISGFSPSSRGQGFSVAISGTNFVSGGLFSTTVTFGGVAAASVSVVSMTSINATVGAGASGDVVVSTYRDGSLIGTATLAGFTFIPAPTVSGFDRAMAYRNEQVIITGTNFNNVSAVTFNGVAAQSFIVNSPTQITAIVGEGTPNATGSVAVTTPGGTGSRSGFTYAQFAPFIISYHPLQAGEGEIITINGNYLLSTTAVSFGGTAASSFIVIDDDTITAVVGNGSSGSVQVVSPFGSDSSPSFVFLALTTQPVRIGGVASIDSADAARDGFPELDLRFAGLSVVDSVDQPRDPFPPLMVRVG